MMEMLDAFLRKLTFLVLSFVTAYGRLTDGWHPLLGIFAPVALLAGLSFIGPVWLTKALMAISVLFAGAFLLAVAYMVERFMAHE